MIILHYLYLLFNRVLIHAAVRPGTLAELVLAALRRLIPRAVVRELRACLLGLPRAHLRGERVDPTAILVRVVDTMSLAEEEGILIVAPIFAYVQLFKVLEDHRTCN